MKLAGVLGFEVSQGSITITLPPGVVMRVVAWPSHSTSVLPAVWAEARAAVHSAVTASSARATSAERRLWNSSILSPGFVGMGDRLKPDEPAVAASQRITMSPVWLFVPALILAGRGRGSFPGGHPAPYTAPMPRARYDSIDALRGVAIVWMTVYHFCFDLNHFGWLHQDFYRDPFWTWQRTAIVSLFLFCAGLGQAVAFDQRQGWPRFWKRWAQVAGCALLVTLGSWWMFPKSFIYFGVLHGIAVMLIVVRLTAGWGRWLWLAGAAGHRREAAGGAGARPVACAGVSQPADVELAGADQPQADHRGLRAAAALAGRDVVGHGGRPVRCWRAAGEWLQQPLPRAAGAAGLAGALEPVLVHAAPAGADRR